MWVNGEDLCSFRICFLNTVLSSGLHKPPRFCPLPSKLLKTLVSSQLSREHKCVTTSRNRHVPRLLDTEDGFYVWSEDTEKEKCGNSRRAHTCKKLCAGIRCSTTALTRETLCTFFVRVFVNNVFKNTLTVKQLSRYEHLVFLYIHSQTKRPHTPRPLLTICCHVSCKAQIKPKIVRESRSMSTVSHGILNSAIINHFSSPDDLNIFLTLKSSDTRQLQA